MAYRNSFVGSLVNVQALLVTERLWVAGLLQRLTKWKRSSMKRSRSFILLISVIELIEQQSPSPFKLRKHHPSNLGPEYPTEV